MKTTNLRHQYCLLLAVAILLLVVGFIMLIVFAIPSLEPYAHTRHFHSTYCDVISVNVTVSRKCDYVGAETKDTNVDTGQVLSDSPSWSSYPCLQVRVNFSDDVQTSREGFLFDKYSSKVAKGTHDNISCSVHICDEDTEENAAEVLQFLDELTKTDSSFICYFNPDDDEFALRTIVNSDKVLHAFLWPSLALAFGFVIIVIIVFFACENLVCHDLLSGAKKARSEGKIYRLASFRNEELAKCEIQKRELQAERSKSWRVDDIEASGEHRPRSSTSILERLKRFSTGGSLKGKQDKAQVRELKELKRRNSVG